MNDECKVQGIGTSSLTCYNGLMPLDLSLGDILRLRKPHPCGGYDWEVVRVGADIGIRCLTCGHKVLLERRDLERRLKTFVKRAVVPKQE